MKLPHILIANTITWLAVLAVIVFIFLTDAEGNPRLPTFMPEPAPKTAPRTITVDDTQCHLWPLEREYATTDPVFFWLCPDAGDQGGDTWGLAWDFTDIQPGGGSRP